MDTRKIKCCKQTVIGYKFSYPIIYLMLPKKVGYIGVRHKSISPAMSNSQAFKYEGESGYKL